MKKKRRAAEQPYDEQKLREEVRYLHSLWHQGPPSSPPNPNPDQKRKTMAPDSGSPWPCPAPTQTPSLAGWPTTGPVYPPLTAQDLETHSALVIQLRACKAFREFCSNSDDDQHEDDDVEDEYWVGRGEDKSRFFLRIFAEDEELRKYYEADHEGGDYCCFVCGANGKGKRFRSCPALAQHSKSMAKADKNRSHSAFGRTVCMVLGWDFERLPSVVLKGEPLGRSLGNAGAEKLGENVNGVVKDDNGGDLVEKDGVRGVWTDDGKKETTLGVIGDNEVKEDDNRDESVDKAGFENLQVDDTKCSKEDDKHTNEDKEGNPSEDGDEDEEEDPSEEEEEDSSEDGDEEEDPSEVKDPTEIGNEEEDPTEIDDEEDENPSQSNDEEEDPTEIEDEEEIPSEEDENPSQNNDEVEDPSEHRDEDERKNDSATVYKDSTALKELGVAQKLEGK